MSPLIVKKQTYKRPINYYAQWHVNLDRVRKNEIQCEFCDHAYKPEDDTDIYCSEFCRLMSEDKPEELNFDRSI